MSRLTTMEDITAVVSHTVKRAVIIEEVGKLTIKVARKYVPLFDELKHFLPAGISYQVEYLPFWECRLKRIKIISNNFVYEGKPVSDGYWWGDCYYASRKGELCK